jgi:SAM-dependent methyltransferase
MPDALIRPADPPTQPAQAAQPVLAWDEGDARHTARWRSERGAPAPKRVALADDTMPADAAYRLACEGTGLLWRGDFQNARLLLLALERRIDPVPRRKARAAQGPAPDAAAAELPGAAFHRHRQAQSQRARVLAQVLIPLAGDYAIPLRRAPDHRGACAEAWGPADGAASVVSLRELLGVVSAHEWRKKGVPIPALGPAPDNRIRPHYGVFSPVRGEYVDLVAHTELPPGAQALAFDIGTGTGVLAAVLARRGVAQVVATEQDPRALACAAQNLAALGLETAVQLQALDLFPPGAAALVVCNPPWLPARASAPIERAVYDEDSRMLLGFLAGLADHLLPGGEGWLIMSDLAEHLSLRTRAELLAAFEQHGLTVLGRLETQAQHPKATDPTDPLHAARAAERTSLWRLGNRMDSRSQPGITAIGRHPRACGDPHTVILAHAGIHGPWIPGRGRE